MDVLYSVEKEFKVEFFDVDAMKIAWHGNYVKYMEIGRCALLDELGYGYLQMVEDEYAFPVTDIKLKYIRSLMFNEICKIKCDLVEYENCLKINYTIFNSKGQIATKASSTQMVFNVKKNESEFVCPPRLLERFNKKINKK